MRNLEFPVCYAVENRHIKENKSKRIRVMTLRLLNFMAWICFREKDIFPLWNSVVSFAQFIVDLKCRFPSPTLYPPFFSFFFSYRYLPSFFVFMQKWFVIWFSLRFFAMLGCTSVADDMKSQWLSSKENTGKIEL